MKNQIGTLKSNNSYQALAFANHKTGDFPLPELIVAADFNEDGKLDLAVNVTGFDNVAIGTVALYQNTIGYDNTAGDARSLSSRP